MTPPPHDEPAWRASRVAYADVRALERALGCPEALAWILVRRGLGNPDAAREFMAADGDLADPEALPGIAEAADRLALALRRGESVAIHGDYDCDGVCSTAILAGALRARGGKVTTFLPSRFTDGYGVSEATVERLADDGAQVLVCVDCGTSSVDPLTRAHELGMDVIVADHHLAAGARPPGILANPALGRGVAALPAAAGVVFDLVRALARRVDGDLLAPGPDEGVDLAGLATVADAVPLVGDNRRLVHRALAAIRRGERPGIVALCRAAGTNHRSITPRGLSFTLAPAINAAGRLKHADRALELMLTDDPRQAAVLAEELWALNAERRDVERRVTAEAVAILEAEPAARREGVAITVVAGEGWHEGVVGIVASRMVERFGRPAIVLATQGDEAKGSGRSLPGVDLHGIVSASSSMLVRWGGHSGAVGVSLGTDDIPAFREALEAAADGRRAEITRAKVRTVDAVVGGPDLTLATAEALEALAPFGRGNPEPRIVIPGCAVTQVSRVGGGTHLRARLAAGGVAVPAIGFGMGERGPGLEERADDRFDAVARLEVERWQDTVGPRVVLEALEDTAGGPEPRGQCASPCDLSCPDRVTPQAIRAMLTDPFGVPPVPDRIDPPREVRDRRGEGRALPLIVALAGADDGVVAIVSDIPRRRAALRDVLAPGRLGVEVAVIGGVRCDPAALRGRLAHARGGPLLALLDHRALAEWEIPDNVHLVVVDPPVSDAEVGWLRVAAAGRTVHLAWGDEETALALRVAEDDLAVRDTARALWPALIAASEPIAWGNDLDAALAGDAAVARSPRAVAGALAALGEAGLLAVTDSGVVAVAGAGTADLDATPTGIRAAALLAEARGLAAIARTIDPFADPPPHADGPEWRTGALS